MTNRNIYGCTFMIFLLIITIFSYGQGSKATIKNINFTVSELGQSIDVSYDIVNASPIEEFNIILAFVDDQDYYIYPAYVRGDVGPGVKAGRNKTISWDYSKEDVYLGRIKAIVYTESITLAPKGAKYGLLSLAVPGLGDRYVSYTKDDIIKPIYITAACYGLVSLGVIQKIRSNNIYNDYLESSLPSDFESQYQHSNNLHHQALISTGLGTGIWITDFVVATIKGKQNSKKIKSNYTSQDHLIITPNNYGGLNAVCLITF